MNLEKTSHMLLHDQMVKLVDGILSEKNSLATTTKLDQEIDQLVYKLYDLTADEIKIMKDG